MLCVLIFIHVLRNGADISYEEVYTGVNQHHDMRHSDDEEGGQLP